MAKLEVQSEDQVVWADGTEGPGARPSGLCCMWPWEERKHRRDQAVHGEGAGQQSLSTATPSESTRTREHPVPLLVPCVTTHKAMPRWTNFSPSAHTIHKHTYTCAGSHVLLIPHTDPTQPAPAKGQFPLSPHIWENKSQRINLALPPTLRRGPSPTSTVWFLVSRAGRE